jgi:predicted nucleic acid-binding protein
MTARIGDVLVDSSGWIQLLRQKGDADVRDRLKQLIVSDRAVWCDVVQLELWRGAGSESDRKMLRDLQTEIRSLEISPDVWKQSFLIAGKCRPKGIIVPTTDLMIFACARTHGVELFHRDKHFDLLTNSGLV